MSKFAVYEFLINDIVYCGYAQISDKAQVEKIVKMFLDPTTKYRYHPRVMEDYKKYGKYNGFKIIEIFDFREEAEELTQKLKNEETRPSYNRKTNRSYNYNSNNKKREENLDVVIDYFEKKVMKLFNSEENLILSVNEIAMKINHPLRYDNNTNYLKFIHDAANSLVKKGFLYEDTNGSKNEYMILGGGIK